MNEGKTNMKRKMTSLILAMLTAVTLTACGNEPAENSSGATTPPSSQTTEQQNTTTPDAAADAFEQFKAALDDAGYTYEVVPMAAELVGAERGEKYKFDFGSVELYRFAAGADPLTSGEVTLEGFGAFPIEVNGDYGLLVSLDENEDAIKAIFDELK